MKDLVPYLAGAVGVVSALMSFVSVRTARRSLAIARATGQASFEATRFNREPPLDLRLTSVTFRGPTKMNDDGTLVAAHSEEWLKNDADHLEIVVKGYLRNRLDQELLLTFRGPANDDRQIFYSYRHHDVWQLDDQAVKLAGAVLAPNQKARFTWIDRRPPESWATLRRSRAGSRPGGRTLKFPKPRLSDLLLVARHPRAFTIRSLRAGRLPRIGFRVAAETRAAERLTVVWTAEVTADPWTMIDEANKSFFDPAVGACTIPGPLDDDIIKYRVAYDPVLASIERKRIINVSGRS